MEEQNKKPEDTSPESVSTEEMQAVSDNEQQSLTEQQSLAEQSSTAEQPSQVDEEAQVAIEAYQQTADQEEASATYTPQGTVEQNTGTESDGIHVAPATISSPFHAIKAIILKPNPVFAKLKDTGNWSWIPFLIVVFCSALPSWLYFNNVDMNWYTDLIVQLEYADVSPSEKAQMKQMMMQDNLGEFTVIGTVIGLVLMYAVFALYLHKITQIDEDNVLSYGDWYGFMWWVSIPFAIFSLITALVIVIHGGPEIRPEILSPLSLAYLLGLSVDSDWFGWAQGVGPDTLWSVYLMTVGISQWTKLTSRQCLIIAAAPFVIIWGVWAAFIIL